MGLPEQSSSGHDVVTYLKNNPGHTDNSNNISTIPDYSGHGNSIPEAGFSSKVGNSVSCNPGCTVSAGNAANVWSNSVNGTSCAGNNNARNSAIDTSRNDTDSNNTRVYMDSATETASRGGKMGVTSTYTTNYSESGVACEVSNDLGLTDPGIDTSFDSNIDLDLETSFKNNLESEKVVFERNATNHSSDLDSNTANKVNKEVRNTDYVIDTSISNPTSNSSSAFTHPVAAKHFSSNIETGGAECSTIWSSPESNIATKVPNRLGYPNSPFELSSINDPKNNAELSGQVRNLKAKKNDKSKKEINNRTTYTDYQKKVLEHEFDRSHFPNRKRRDELVTELGLDEIKLNTWFQNRRMKEKKLMPSVATTPSNKNGSIRHGAPRILKEKKTMGYRTTFTRKQKVTLEMEYEQNSKLNYKRRAEIANRLGLKEAAVKNWFQNRRAKGKKESLPEKYFEVSSKTSDNSMRVTPIYTPEHMSEVEQSPLAVQPDESTHDQIVPNHHGLDNNPTSDEGPPSENLLFSTSTWTVSETPVANIIISAHDVLYDSQNADTSMPLLNPPNEQCNINKQERLYNISNPSELSMASQNPQSNMPYSVNNQTLNNNVTYLLIQGRLYKILDIFEPSTTLHTLPSNMPYSDNNQFLNNNVTYEFNQGILYNIPNPGESSATLQTLPSNMPCSANNQSVNNYVTPVQNQHDVSNSNLLQGLQDITQTYLDQEYNPPSTTSTLFPLLSPPSIDSISNVGESMLPLFPMNYDFWDNFLKEKFE